MSYLNTQPQTPPSGLQGIQANLSGPGAAPAQPPVSPPSPPPQPMQQFVPQPSPAPQPIVQPPVSPTPIPSSVLESTGGEWAERIKDAVLSTDSLNSADTSVTLTEGSRDVFGKAANALGASISTEDMTRLADLQSYYLGADGVLAGGPTQNALGGASEALSKMGLSDPDMWRTGENYNFKELFGSDFMKNFINKVETSSGFSDRAAVVEFLNKLYEATK